MQIHVTRAILAAALAGAAALTAPTPPAGAGGTTSPVWMKVVDTTDVMPGTTGVLFNSFNQPSVSDDGTVVIRARSRGPEAVHGIYLRDMGRLAAPVVIMDRGMAVPNPNNEDARFTEFPSFPRIDASSNAVASRAQSQPVWRHLLVDGTEAVTGTSGIYTTARGTLETGMSLLGAVAGFEEFSVPGRSPATRFDVFPGAPAITDRTVVVFKGNYTDGSLRKTGVFYRDVAKPGSPVVHLASTGTPIPSREGTVFGSVAPPSAASGKAVFVGWDNEENPTAGGIYLTKLSPKAALKTVVSIGSSVPGQARGAVFRQFGEGLSFDGRYVAFWGTWGTETLPITLFCPDEGNAARLAYCLEHDDGVVREVPVNQGVFVHDIATGRTVPVAVTGGDIVDFRYWSYTGHAPGEDGDEAGHEPPAWRASSFVAVSGKHGPSVAFKARTASGTDRVEVRRAGPRGSWESSTVAETGTTAATVFDADASPGSVVTAVGVERDGFRNGWLALAVSMGEGEDHHSGVSGIYIARV